MPLADFTFSGTVKEIIINPGVTGVDVQDMYSSWKVWVQDTDNSKYLQAFRTFGGDATIPGQFAPRYFFLTNGWKVRVENNEDVDFGVNLYTDDVGTSSFIVGSGSSVTSRNSDAVVVEAEIAESLDYAGIVHVNPNIGITGTSYPIGTIAQPVSNFTDALSIATSRGIYEYNIYGSVVLDIDIHNSTIHGGNITDMVDIQNVNLSGTTFRECLIMGEYTGTIAATNCVLESSLTGMEGLFQNCGVRGSLYFSDGVNCDFFDGASQTPGTASPSIYLGTDVNLSLRKYSGGLAVYDCGSGSTVSLEFVAGNCRMLSGNTGGHVEIRGLAQLTDNTSGTTLGVDGLLIPISVAQQQALNVNTEITKNK